MLQEGYYVFTVDHPTIAVELKVARPNSLLLDSDVERGIGIQPSIYMRVCLFHSKATENIKN